MQLKFPEAKLMKVLDTDNDNTTVFFTELQLKYIQLSITRGLLDHNRFHAFYLYDVTSLEDGTFREKGGFYPIFKSDGQPQDIGYNQEFDDCMKQTSGITLELILEKRTRNLKW